jgi:hypothetical protein
VPSRADAPPVICGFGALVAAFEIVGAAISEPAIKEIIISFFIFSPGFIHPVGVR